MCFGELTFSEMAFGKFATVHSFCPKWLIKKFLLNKYGAIPGKNSCENKFYLSLKSQLYCPNLFWQFLDHPGFQSSWWNCFDVIPWGHLPPDLWGCSLMLINQHSLLFPKRRLEFLEDLLCFFKKNMKLDCYLTLFLKFSFYWSIIGLSVVWVSGTQQSDSVIYIYMCSFSYPFPLWFIMGYWMLFFPVQYSRTLLVIQSLYNSCFPLVLSRRIILIFSWNKNIS